jgi:putative glutamine amidotransferase
MAIPTDSERTPLIGVTADIEASPQGKPPRPFYVLDSRTFDALRVAGAAAVILPHEIDMIPRYLKSLDGIVVSGGGYQFPHPELFGEGADGSDSPEKLQRAAFERALIVAAIEADMPLLGVCGGFQLMNAVCGGKLIVSLAASRPSSIQHRQTESYAQGTHTVRAEPDSDFARWFGPQPALVNSKHSQGVIEVGPRARVAARAPDDLVEAIEVPQRRFALGVQWHPEFHVTPSDNLIFERFVEAARRR